MFIGLILLLLITIGVFFMSKHKIVCPRIELINFDFFGHNIRINKKFEAYYLSAKLKIYECYPHWIPKIKRMDSYNCRYIRGAEYRKIISYHGYGQAIDINPSDYPSIRLKDKNGNVIGQKYDLPLWFREVAGCFTWVGFRWGGNWNSLYDPMHFEIGTRVV